MRRLAFRAADRGAIKASDSRPRISRREAYLYCTPQRSRDEAQRRIRAFS
ncbi:MAG: hypothetical protein MZV70_06335 [Desulfobacterales bacterium]|nr:hypothetical protein [Desulfobacterales bacterium]